MFFNFLSLVIEKGLILIVIIYVIFLVGKSVMKSYTMNLKTNESKNNSEQVITGAECTIKFETSGQMIPPGSTFRN